MSKKFWDRFIAVVGFMVAALSISLFSQEALAFCVKDSESCVESAETRLINGLPVTRDCWRYASQYTCDGTVAIPDSHCQDLIDQGCSPLSQVCDTDSCVQTYECITGTVTRQEGVGCESQTVDVNGLELDTGYEANTDFALAAANMTAINEATTGILANDLSCAETAPGSGEYTCAEDILIFNGQDRACRKDSLGFNQCCNLDGWGTDSGLAVCNQDEELLGYARQEGRTHYIGSYCTHSNIFGCYAHKYVYCEFTSKIARIIQEQGRPQLGIGWGSPTAPNCAGFTDSQLSSLNFDLIDFSEYFADAFESMANPPGPAAQESIINNYVNTLQDSGCSQFDPNC